ncbi:P1 family peptidase [Halobacillus sp. A1]|uniref:DmpA family aminopeptidase n=1 Tax=Halobacillus sp. A1 TaxID=2880262 RepID=UPI0020A6DA5A|nr:P1 family peptidase [Halobacillus sp. A1]MCP3030874.1 P1 family peptidase [Halobacillus sp. A1]
MKKLKRIKDYGVDIGHLRAGKNNLITDVPGVTVGQVTLSDKQMQTGVTAILPHQGDLFHEKVISSTYVNNGFGKTMGLVQVEEMGTIETPIVLTNTLNIGTAADAVIDYMLSRTPEIGRTTGTINPIVGECNDMFLNDIRERYVTKEHVTAAINQASDVFKEGTEGAGTGMLCYSLKGGVGSSSRLIELRDETYTLGVYVVTNFSALHDLMIGGRPIGKDLHNKLKTSEDEKDKGSVMIIAATDLPVTERQLNRILKRSVTGLSRTGSIIANGSGEIVIGFSTATKIPHNKTDGLQNILSIHEEDLDIAFRAIGEATEEAVLNSLITARHVVGRNGNEKPALRDLLHKFSIELNK